MNELLDDRFDHYIIFVLFLLYSAWFNISLLKCVTSYHSVLKENK